MPVLDMSEAGRLLCCHVPLQTGLIQQPEESKPWVLPYAHCPDRLSEPSDSSTGLHSDSIVKRLVLNERVNHRDLCRISHAGLWSA